MPNSDSKYQVVEIVDRRDYAPDLWSIRVKPEQKLSFAPGQYATLGVEKDGTVVERPYSIVSSPLEEEIEFFFELVPHGGLTPLLYELKAGDRMLMRRQAKGRFTLDEKSGHTRHFLVATVTGVAPYVSMVRTLARVEKEGKLPAGLRLLVLEAASRSWEFGYHDELAELAGKCSWLTFVPTISRPWEDEKWKGEVGRAEDVLRKYLDNLQFAPDSATAYLCGHPQMIENAKGILQRRGFPKESLREEIYWVPKKEK
jgi:ferredoxin--NADP+ reductase